MSADKNSCNLYVNIILCSFIIDKIRSDEVYNYYMQLPPDAQRILDLFMINVIMGLYINYCKSNTNED
jgi:hypothetical protein